MKKPNNAPGPLSLNTATVRAQWSLQQCIEGCLRHGITGISPWRDKLAEYGLANAARHIRDAGLTVTGLCRGGMFPASDAAGRRAALEENFRAVDEAAALNAQCLVLVVGGMPAGSKDISGARQQVQDGIAALLQYARPAGVKLAIEPLHPMYAADRACVNTLGQALDICDSLGNGPEDAGGDTSGDISLGVAADVYHIWWDPDLEAQIKRAGRRILGFHICDWLVPTRDLLLDRGMMGDGVIDIPAIRAQVEAAGYDGFCEVEIMSSENWWKRDADEVLRVCVERHASVV